MEKVVVGTAPALLHASGRLPSFNSAYEVAPADHTLLVISFLGHFKCSYQERIPARNLFGSSFGQITQRRLFSLIVEETGFFLADNQFAEEEIHDTAVLLHILFPPADELQAMLVTRVTEQKPLGVLEEVFSYPSARLEDVYLLTTWLHRTNHPHLHHEDLL